MAEVVDAIIADLIVRNLDKYEADFNRATAVHDKFARSTDKLKAQTFDLGAEGQKYKQGTNAIGAAEEGLTQRVTRTRKARADTAVAQSNRETAAAKKAAKEQADAAIAEAQREEATVRRIRNMVAQSTSSGGVKRGSGRIASTSVPGERTGQGAIPLSVLNGGSEATAAEAEINHMLADRAKLQAALTFANKEDAAVIRDKLAELRLINQLQRAGLGDAEIAVELEKRALAVEIERAAVAGAASRRAGAKNAEQFARGAGAFAATGGAAAIAGIVTAGGIALVAKAAEAGLEYAKTIKQVSDQLGVSTKSLQVWEIAAAEAGVTSEQLREGFGQLSSNIGKAQEGSKEQAKIFKALGIDLGNTKDGYKSLNDILPAFMDKLAKIPDQARRMALETALGGEQLRKLDPILKNGSGSFDELTKSIEATGGVLSNTEIQNAAKTAQKLRLLGDQLERKLSSTVAENAEAINQLANTFFRLASGILTAFAALQKWAAVQAMSNPSFMATESDRQANRGVLLSSAGGRNAYSQIVQRGAKTIANAARNVKTDGGQFFVEGVGWVDNTAEGRRAALTNLQKQFGDIRGAQAADSADVTAPVGGGPDLSKLFAGPGKKGPKDKTAEQDKHFADEMARLQDEQLQAQSEQTQDELARLDIKEQQLNTDRDRRIKDYDQDVKNGRLRKDQADALKAQLLNDTYAAQVSVIHRDHDLEALKRTYDTAVAIIDAKEDELRDQESLAKTVAERARIEKQLLDLERQKETLGANYTIDRAANDDSSVSTSDLNAANRTLKTQDKRFADRSATIAAQNRGPLGDYLASLPNTVDQVNEAMERAAASGLQKLDDGLTSAVAKFLHLHGIAGEFLQDLIKIGIERELLIPLANMLFPQQGASAGLGSGGGGFGGILSALGGLFGHGGDIAGNLGSDWGAAGSAFSPSSASSLLSFLPAFATGGSGIIGGNYGTDRNVLSLNGQPFARVNRGEPFAIGPNIGAANGRVNSGPAPSVVVVQPIHADFTGARTDEQTMRQFQAYADARSRQAYEAAVSTAAGQAPGVIAQAQTLKG